uniref:Uncharacterized protein n=1 Tax=Peronospora matthiolae TaxID=2874970 RepID=A0AAV1UWP4_9STRA
MSPSETKRSRSSSGRYKSSRRSEDGRSSRHKSRSKHDSKLDKNSAKAITEEDYFLRQTEFRVWLTQTKGKYVDDLSTAEAMKLFCTEFAKKWNRGQLASMFYQGLSESVVEQTKRTRHRWNFVSKLSDKEKFEVATAKDSVDVATKKADLLLSSSGQKGEPTEAKSKFRDRDSRRAMEGIPEDREETKKRRKTERRREKEYGDTIVDELAPKATGREAQLMKRRQIGAKLHGAARDREEARDGLDLDEGFLMGVSGGGNDELKRHLARRDAARCRKQKEQSMKIADLKAKESARMDKFLEDMGITAGPATSSSMSATIAPRQ